MPSQDNLEKTVAYMKAHWPSPVKSEWQVSMSEYPDIVKQVIADLSKGKTSNHQFIRIAGLSGSGKTTQILPAVEMYFAKKQLHPILVAARIFVKYHPHYQEILNFYGEKDLRKMTDEFSTIMMFLTLSALTKAGCDIVLDVTLLDPEIEQILLGMLAQSKYNTLLLMMAVSPAVTEHFLKNRAWRHSVKTEREFIRATEHALNYYAKSVPDMRIIIWSVYDRLPIFDGPVKDSLEVFRQYSSRTDLPRKDDDARRKAKIEYLQLV